MIKILCTLASALTILTMDAANAAPPSHNDILKLERDILRILSPKTVFITSGTFNGNIGGLAGADAICQSAAESAGLSGTFMAWLSDSQESPGTRFLTYSVGPYIDVRGRPVAADYGDLVDGALSSILLSDEFGDDTPGVVWTSTKSSGIIVSSSNTESCADWTSNSSDASLRGLVGITAGVDDDDWTSLEFRSCDNLFHLYCFQQ